MDEAAKKIINIDNSTRSMKDRYKRLIDAKENQLKDKLAGLEKLNLEASIKEGEEVYKQIIDEAKAIIDHGHDTEDDLLNKYNEIKNNLLDDIWVQILNKN